MKPNYRIATKILVFIIYCLFVFSSCDNNNKSFFPKPRAYCRIDFPEKKYSLLNDSCPFTFEYPIYADVLPNPEPVSEPCWKNICFPRFSAQIYISYKTINHNLRQYIEDAYTLASKHQIKASGMPETLVKNDSTHVYGLIFKIEGNTASSLQFYLTDSTRHFVRGALYFYSRPNYDSLAPVIDFLKKDVDRMIATFKWKEAGRK
ncbi:MAG: gliding motility lipoprotein GldD [Bacteroidota bacterium]